MASLNHLCGGRDFLWHFSPPQGRSGGILLGVDPKVFDIGSIDAGDFYVKFHLKNREDDFQWVLVAVYGAAQNQFKEKFLNELVHACRKESLPILIRGDFNIIRHAGEKNNDNFEYR